MNRPAIVGICGSRRNASVTRRALSEGLAAAESSGATSTQLDLDDFRLPPYDPDRNHADGERLRAAIGEADGVILATPMYHGSYSGVIKNALDYCGRDEFEDTTVGLLAVSGGRFPTLALDHLRSVCRALQAWVLPRDVALPRARHAFEHGEFVDEELRERVRELGRQLVRASRSTGRNRQYRVVDRCS